jgi:site-specific DNA recombinase
MINQDLSAQNISHSNHSNNNPLPLAAIYIRVSTEDQALHGFSLPAQESALKNYCSALGYQLHEIYRDEGKSAKDIQHRPAMQKLLSDAENRLFSAIFIYKLDRFSRSLKDLILTIEKLKEWGVDFISLQDKIETASASGKLMFHIISAFAEFERNIIGERTTFGMQRKFSEGGAITKPPLGYKMVNKQLIVDESKATQVREIFSQYAQTPISLNRLAKLYDLSVNGVKKVLMNSAYLGETKFAGETTKGIHQAIIARPLFDAVQYRLQNTLPSSKNIK